MKVYVSNVADVSSLGLKVSGKCKKANMQLKSKWASLKMLYSLQIGFLFAQAIGVFILDMKKVLHINEHTSQLGKIKALRSSSTRNPLSTTGYGWWR